MEGGIWREERERGEREGGGGKGGERGGERESRERDKVRVGGRELNGWEEREMLERWDEWVLIFVCMSCMYMYA